MIRSLIVVSLIFALSPKGFAADSCADLMARLSTARDKTNVSQEQVKSKESEIHALAKEYAERLGPYQDPFALAFNIEQGDRIFQRLTIRNQNGKWVTSPLAIINFNLKKEYVQSRQINWKLVDWMISDARKSLTFTKEDRTDLQSNLLGLKYTLEYLRRFKEPEKIVDRDGKPQEKKTEQEEKKDSQKNQQQQNQKQQNQKQQSQKQKQQKEEEQKQENENKEKKGQGKQDQPPEYPELPKEYKPTTKDPQNKGSGESNEHRVAEVNFSIPFFAQRYFSEINRGVAHPFREGILPTLQSAPQKHRQTGKDLVIRTFGKQEVSLFLPPLFVPVQPSDPRAVISRTDSGGFTLKLKDNLSEVQIPLVEETGIIMMPPAREIYTRPVGFNINEWPDLIQVDIIRKFSSQDATENPLRVAQAIADHIATEYLYSVGPKPETDPIAALIAGAFQCDMAAFAMIGLLRDVYHIPSRIVGGYRAKSFQGAKDSSYLVIPGEAHAWVEVFHDGKWHLFDPTPVKKDIKDDKKGGGKYSDNRLENTPKPDQNDKKSQENSQGSASDSSQESQSQQSKDNQGNQSKDSQDHKKRMEENTKKRTGDSKAESKKGKTPDGSDGKTGKDKQNTQSKSEKTANQKKGENGDSKEKQNSEKNSTKGSGQGQGTGKGEEDNEDSDTQSGKRASTGTDKSHEKTTSDEEDNTVSKTSKELTKEELANQLELGSLELEPRLDRNALLERAMRTLLQIAVEPTQRGGEIQNKLNQLSSLMRRFSSIELKTFYQDALSSHASDHPGLKNWIDSLVRLMPTQDINLTYQEVYRIRKAVEVYSKVLDRNGKVPLPEKLLGVLEETLQKLGELAHPDSQDIALVQDLVKNLPSVVRLLLKSQFNLESVGPNAPTREVARLLKTGKLNDLRLLSILSPLSDFILNSTPRPEKIEVKTWTRDSRRPRGRDIMPLTRFSDLSRAILGQPGKSIEQNIQEGTAYVPAYRQRIDIPAGYGKEEAERITIVLYDTSGSMAGDPGKFQAGLIGAFTGRALSDLAPSGRHRHRVVIVPFDDEPGTPVRVTNSQEAIDVIRNYQKKLKNTGQGTNIQKALLQSMSLIADAEKRSGEPLASANIVLMTDGEAEIDEAALLRARNAIDRQTPLQTMFISINKTNEDLMKFARASRSMGVEQGFYREFTPDHISDILDEAKHLDLSKVKDAFYSQKSGQAISNDIYSLMDQALKLAAQFTDQIYYGTRHQSAREHLEDLEKLKWNNVRQIDRPLEKWILRVRNFVLHPIFQDRRILERVVDDLVSNIEQLTGIKKNELSDHEQEQLKHLVRCAAGLESCI